MVESELVFRHPDERDRRRILVFLSEHGRQIHLRLAPEVQRIEGELTGQLGPDAPHLLHLLHRLATCRSAPLGTSTVSEQSCRPEAAPG